MGRNVLFRWSCFFCGYMSRIFLQWFLLYSVVLTNVFYSMFFVLFLLPVLERVHLLEFFASCHCVYIKNIFRCWVAIFGSTSTRQYKAQLHSQGYISVFFLFVLWHVLVGADKSLFKICSGNHKIRLVMLVKGIDLLQTFILLCYALAEKQKELSFFSSCMSYAMHQYLPVFLILWIILLC